MNELVLLLDRRDASMNLEGGSLAVRRPGRPVEHVPLGLLGQVIVLGNPEVGPGVLRALGERGVPTVLLPLRGKGEGVWVGGGLGTSIAVRVAQHRAARESRGLEIARSLVRDKLEGYAVLAADRGMDEAASVVREQQDRLDSAEDREELMGLEGAAASAWWTALAVRLDAGWRFSGRNRRPPRDPVNAMLSLGYTLLGSEMAMAVRTLGLDPALGFLHGVVPGRESLVLDLVEPLRAGVDAFVLEQLEAGWLTPADFRRSTSEGCRLRKEVRGRFYEEWATRRMDWSDPLRPGEPLPRRCAERARWLREALGPYDPQSGEAAFG